MVWILFTFPGNGIYGDHLIQDFDSSKENFGVVSDHPGLMDINYTIGPAAISDWVHVNAVHYNPELDQICLSAAHVHEVWIIDHSTTTAEAAGHTGGNSDKGGDILYRWGNPRVYDRGTEAEQKLFGQHDIRWIPAGLPNEGNLLVFNNGMGRLDGNYSSVDRWTPPMNNDGTYILEPGQAYGPESASWTYVADDFYSPRISGVQPLPNGNLLVCEGNDGYLFEITADEEIVWQYENPVANGNPVSQGSMPFGNDTFRSTRFPVDYSAFAGKDLTPGNPIELEPFPSNCMIFDGPTTSTNDLQLLQSVQIRSNPFTDLLTIDSSTGEPIDIKILDMSGKLITSLANTTPPVSLVTNGWPPGLFIVWVVDQEKNKSTFLKAVKR